MNLSQKILSIIKKPQSNHPPSPQNEHQHLSTFRNATAHLLAHVAFIDDNPDERELNVATDILVNAFGDTQEQARETIINAANHAEECENWYADLRTISHLINQEERLNLLSYLWQVVLADQKIDDYEANFMRRMAGLLGISDKDTNAIKVKIKQQS
jgi:uncharacterized tellurite resistance protein B-like protein